MDLRPDHPAGCYCRARAPPIPYRFHGVFPIGPRARQIPYVPLVARPAPIMSDALAPTVEDRLVLPLIVRVA